MRVLIAPDSFKGSLGAADVAAALAAGLARGFPGAAIATVPVADGGEGTAEALVAATGGRMQRRVVTGPLGDPVEAHFGILGDGETAVIEMAAASGLPLVPPALRNPLRTTTYGTGELIRAALDAGCRRIILGLGGSATHDAGAGMAQALGIRLLDRSGEPIGRGGEALFALARIDRSGRDPRLDACEIRVACDVDNPLTGPSGAARVYGPQKGARPEMLERMDQALAHFAAVVRRELGLDLERLPGAGAAGGMGAGTVAFLGARLERGIRLVIEAVRLEEHVRASDLVITGEGRIDAQAAFGKAPAGVARLAQQMGKPVIAVAGGLGEGFQAVYEVGVDVVIPIVSGPMRLEEAMAGAAGLLEETGERIGRMLSVARALFSVRPDPPA